MLGQDDPPRRVRVGTETEQAENELACEVEGPGKLVRLHANEPDQAEAAVAGDAFDDIAWPHPGVGLIDCRDVNGNVRPKHWARRRAEWIFVGHDHLRGTVRIFYLSRVRSLRQVGLPKEEAERRTRLGRTGDYDVPESFDVRSWSRQQVWEYHVHPPAAAAVRFRGSLAGIAKQLLPAAEVITDGTGARVARLEVRNLRGLVRQALAWGPEAEVIEPAEARATAREILASIGDALRGSP